MIKRFLTALLIVLAIPLGVKAAFSTPLTGTSTTPGLVYPAPVNGAFYPILAPYYVGTTTATSTLKGGINVTGGCFSVNTVCVGGGSGTINSGTSNRATYYSGATTLDSANFLSVDIANGRIGVGTTTPGTTFSSGNTATGTINLTSTGTSTFRQELVLNPGAAHDQQLSTLTLWNTANAIDTSQCISAPPPGTGSSIDFKTGISNVRTLAPITYARIVGRLDDVWCGVNGPDGLMDFQIRRGSDGITYNPLQLTPLGANVNVSAYGTPVFVSTATDGTQAYSGGLAIVSEVGPFTGNREFGLASCWGPDGNSGNPIYITCDGSVGNPVWPAGIGFDQTDGTMRFYVSGTGYSGTPYGSDFISNGGIQGMQLAVDGTLTAAADVCSFGGTPCLSNTTTAGNITSGTLAQGVGGTGATSYGANRVIFQNAGNTAFSSLSTFVFNAQGNLGIGTSTPYATTSIQTNTGTGDAFVIATTSAKTIFGVDNDGHRFSGGPAPTISSCGTGTGTVVGDDQSGDITTATAATSCTVTFSKAYRNSPVCTVTDNSLVGFADVSSISTTAVTFGISSALTGGHLYYSCSYHK